MMEKGEAMPTQRALHPTSARPKATRSFSSGVPGDDAANFASCALQTQAT